MKRVHLTLLTGLMIFSLAACGKSDTGVIVNVGDISDASESNVIVRDSTEQTESTESTESESITTPSEKEDNKEFSLLGVWCSKDPSENIVYTFDNGNKVSIYQGSTDEYTYGTYETDNKTYVNIITNKEKEEVQSEVVETTESSEMDYTVETAEAIENSVVETETQKFSLSYSTYTNEYEQSFDMIVLKIDNKETELIKTVNIEEKSESELEQEEASNVEEVAEE